MGFSFMQRADFLWEKLPGYLVAPRRRADDRSRFGGRIARIEKDGLGIQFMEVDSESYQHLRRVSLLNSADVQQAEREIEDHLGLKRPES
jgi:hypothetical protein